MQLLRVAAQNFRGVLCRVDRKRDKMHVRFFQRFLQLAHPRADHRAWPGTGRENKIRNPYFPVQLGRAERLTILVDELKKWNRAVGLDRAIGEMVHLSAPDKEKHRRDDQRTAEQHHSVHSGRWIGQALAQHPEGRLPVRSQAAKFQKLRRVRWLAEQ